MDKFKNLPMSIVAVISGLVVVYGIYAFALSRHFDVDQVTISSETHGVLAMTTADMMEPLVSRWLPNDLLLPRAVVDDLPNFELGALDIARHNTRVLRDNLSRMRTTDQIDSDLDESFKLFANDELKWLIPSAESKFSAGIESLRKYNTRLDNGQAKYYPRADNLVQLVDQYISALGGINTRLINAKGGPSLTYETEGDNSTSQEMVIDTQVSWFKIDDNFFFARGSAYALLHSMRAVRVDFKDVLDDKNSLELIDKIIEILERCELSPFIVFNADYDSIFANHSTAMAMLLQDARAKMSSLSRALKDG
jgi:hypothetical protein